MHVLASSRQLLSIWTHTKHKLRLLHDVKAITEPSARQLRLQAETSLKKKQQFFKEHGDLKTLKEQLAEMEAERKRIAKEATARLYHCHRRKRQGTQYRACIRSSPSHRRIWPL